MAVQRYTPRRSTRGRGLATAETSASAQFGRLVAARRLELGLSQQELAVKLGTSHSMVARFEAGEALNIEARRRFADALGIRATARPAPDEPRIARRVGVGLVAAMVALLWLSVIVLDARWVGLGVAAAVVAALWLSGVLEKRTARARMPATMVVTLWLTVIAVGLISNGHHLAGINGRGNATDAAFAALGVVSQSPAGEVLGAFASSDNSGSGVSGDGGAAAGAVQHASLAHAAGGCNSSGAAEGGPARVLAFGIDPFPWTGVRLDTQSGGCGVSRIALAGVRSATARKGIQADSRTSSPVTESPGDSSNVVPDASQSASQGSTSEASHSGASNRPGNNGGGIANTVGSTVSSLGNTVNSLDHALKKP